MTPTQARQVLNAPDHCTAAELNRAFRQAVKAAHPDTGGDAERLRLVVEANEVLKAAPPTPRPAQAPPRKAGPQELQITVREALLGGARRVRTAQSEVEVRLPAGLRAGEVLHITQPGLPDLQLAITIADEIGVNVRGDDLWMRMAAPDREARLELDTPRGRRSVWLSRKIGSKRLLRLSGEGLPARAGRPAGDLIVRLDAPQPRAESPARQMLRQFAGTWAVA
jgi:curved DNA-binding protein